MIISNHNVMIIIIISVKARDFLKYLTKHLNTKFNPCQNINS